MATVHCYACEHKDDKGKDSEDPSPGDLQFMTLDEKSMRIVKARMKARVEAAE
ncbi:hypothetical protein [Brevibacterium aurantiacum]|uniref:hypothetical protein n=1 Tax=Brevibacterium aurantiacum TaxID=273384 RepID=UPI001642B49E|nr:hypothetical protein [Brevibacterium aurantiacum]